MRRRDIEPARALLHPAWIASLAVLLLNDHVLKGSGLLPGLVTGKLSDLAGLVVAPVLLAAIFRVRTPRGVAIACLAVGAGFAGLEMSSTLTAMADGVYRLAGFAWRSTQDPTDLLALAVLPLSYLLTLRAGRQVVSNTKSADRGSEDVAPAPAVERPLVEAPGAKLLGAAGLLACTASSGTWIEQQPLCGTGDCDQDGYAWPEDCDDSNPNVNPDFGCEGLKGENVCNDGTDNDLNGQTDCQDPACAFACADLQSACSATGTFIAFESVGHLKGNTVVGTSVTDGSCVGADSPEVIFQGESPAGTLYFGLPPGHGVHVRADCDSQYSEIACDVWTGMGGGGAGGASGGTGGVGGMAGSGGMGGVGGMTASGGMGGVGGMTGSGGMGGVGGMTASGGMGGVGGMTGSGGMGGVGGMTGSGGSGLEGEVLEVHLDSFTNLTVVVEALDPFQAGSFDVPVVFVSDFVCGNGARESGEQCDDGNLQSGDGCSATCNAEPDVLCAEMAPVAAGQTVGAFTYQSKSFVGTCVGSLDLPEEGYRYTASSASVTVKVTSDLDVGLYATQGCGANATPLACQSAAPAGGTETFTLTTTPGEDITIFVELATPDPPNGTFTLEISEP